MRLPRPAALAALFVVSACGGGGSDTPTVITDPPTSTPASVTVTLPAATVTIGDTIRPTAVVRDARGNVIAGAAVTWKSSASNILDVNASSGVARGINYDTASVVATAGNVTGSARLTVRPVTRATIAMLPNDFLPIEQTIAVNGIITYEFPPGIDHNVIFDRKTGAPADIPQTRNVKVDRQFTTAGTFHYVCRIHPGMEADIIVRQ